MSWIRGFRIKNQSRRSIVGKKRYAVRSQAATNRANTILPAEDGKTLTISTVTT